MAIRVVLNHVTHYRFDRPVALAPHILRLRPAAHSRTPIRGYSLRILPETHFLNWQQDPFGNYLARLVFPERSRELRIEVEVIADLTVINPFDFFIEEAAENYPFAYDPLLARELAPYFETTESGPLLMGWLAGVDRQQRRTVDFLVDLNRRLHASVNYSVRMEPGIQSCEETLGKAIGSCRDSGWLLVQILRHLGLAARFVSGYLVQLTADEKSLDGPSGPEADFTDLHAWAEVYVPGAGWIGLDPTSGLFAGEGHIPLACTPDPASAAPVTGAIDDCEVRFEFSNTVQRIHEDPRVTKPYSDEAWTLIDALGRRVDADLLSGDVRLTMGGEPTFVSSDDMEGAEWNIRADGPHKRKLAYDLTLRLREAFGAGGVLHFGEGKWYPGEPLPRWAYGCFWRKDGVPVWRNPRLLADLSRDDGCDVEAAGRFARQLAKRLGIAPDFLVPGFEDVFYYLWKEGTVPVNCDPLRANLNDPLERRTLAKLLDRGLGEPVGFALPLKWQADRGGWRSGRWEFRRGAMFLIPGSSAMGLRLPLESIPWAAPEEREPLTEQSLFAALPALGDVHGEVARRYSHFDAEAAAHPELREQAPADTGRKPAEMPHTALCVEAREGRLYLFLPPLGSLEHYLDLIASIEATAADLCLPVVIEGYEPPQDWRLERLLVTPDPGVIEVNIHPAASWPELVDTTVTLYHEARLARLGTEKFMLDGRHTGTGGGNHITIGGATPADSPVLRRPDLLRSLVSYWQHHPGLSYLFSGMFIGPTSQAPRVDEGRDELLYELEIAFQQMPEGETPAPWLVDRLLRHLLVDITGNTHRAEFCIDKLYSPDRAAGRLGLVELRAFEMPPHPRMSLVQALLLRTLIAWFWREPYRHPLIRWGTELHDRFLLPHFVRQDLKDVAADLQRAGYPFQLEWLKPFFEFRFPHYGTVQVDNLELELRFAIEPWQVLGEEVSNLGTARFVDSSVERLQLRVTGLTDGRHVIACNGRRLPLRCTGRQDEFVAGVRYRAWQPPSALHPTIKPHSPLVFDVIDTWNGRAIGGCSYHVTHPGGRSYDVFPVNAYEAESRRISRFWDYGHTPGPLRPAPELATLGTFLPTGSLPGPMAPPPEDVNEEFPYTLDLRRGRLPGGWVRMKTSDSLAEGIGGQHFATRLGSYGEIRVAEAQLVPHWEQLLTALEALGGQGLARRRQEAERLLRENGVTYNVYNDPEGTLRAWRLDPIPLLIGSEEWAHLERGLKQRAELLDLILADLYGPRTLIREGLLPFELVHCHAGFQRACVGLPAAGGRHLVLYAANLARGPEGRMWVIDDRSQAPSGSGYALENRTVMTRILPELFRDARIHRLAQFFRGLRAALAQLAPHNRDDPRVVVLTPGPFNETYFEQAYLAAFLGYPLAQGDDLTVREGRVWLKSLEGLQQVDVILRRVDDSFCDPLELRSDSLLGVPGLVEAVRRGHVALANPIGCSLLENPGLLPFLPGLARQLLGTELELPSAATWWCGQERERDFVLANLGELVIKPIQRIPGKSSVYGGHLDRAGLVLWRERIRARPHMYVGQERVSFSTVPALVGEEIKPRHAILRTFLVAGADDYLVMPGGLTRIPPHRESFSVSGQEGGISKDTWVLAAEGEAPVPPVGATEFQAPVPPLLGPLPSRSADNLFWVGRYAERAESTARLLRTILGKLDEQQEVDDPSDAICLEHLLHAATHLTGAYPGFVGEGAASRLSQPLPELRSLLLNEQRSGSLPATLEAFGRSAFAVRDLWSPDAWRVVEDIQQQWRLAQAAPAGEGAQSLQEALDHPILKLVAFSGLTTESMAHDPAWLLLDTGRRLERALLTVALLRATLVACHDEAVAGQILEAVLGTTESLTVFRRRYRSHLQLQAVLELLLLDAKHPRALAYQLRKLQGHIANLPRKSDRPGLRADERLVLEAFTRVRLADAGQLVPAAATGIYSDLEVLLAGVSSLLGNLSDALTRTYFSHAQGPHLLAADRLEVEL